MASTGSDKWKYRVMCVAAFLLLMAGLALAAENWQSYANPAFSGGSGTRDDPWRIATPQQLALLAAKVNEGGSENAQYRVGYYTQTADIDLSAYEWTPIGVATFTWSIFTPVADRSFGGVFDGNGYTISGLRYASTSEVAVGLFGVVDGGQILNVSLEADVNIPAGNQQVGRTIGGIAGLLVNGIVENSDVHGAISGGTMLATSYSNSLFSLVGGVVGQNIGGHILSPRNTATVTGASMTATTNVLSYTGGIVGQNIGEISGAVNGGTVTGGTYGGPLGTSTRIAATGGIAGNLEGGGSISDSLNNASVTGVGAGDLSYVGGIAGVLSGSSVKTSVNNGTVTGGDAVDVSVGGIAGSIFENSSISNTANTGAVSGGTAIVTSNTGGIVGFNSSTIQNTYNFSNVAAGTGSTARTGGVAGINGGTITSAYWNSDLSVSGNQGIGSGSGGVAALNTATFASSTSFAGWSISATTGTPGGNIWFYPAYDLKRPHLALFFNASGQPITSVIPNVASFVVGKNDTQNIVLFAGDDKPSISGIDVNSNPYVDGLTLSRNADRIQLQYANGSVAGTVDGTIRYKPGEQTSASLQTNFTAKVFPVLEIGAQSRTVKQGDVLTLADPLLLPLTVLGGTAIFEKPTVDSVSGLTAEATTDGTAIRLTGTAGTPGSYPVGVRGTVNGLSILTLGTVAIQPSGVSPTGNIIVLGMNPSTATVNTSTAFTATTSAPVAGATLRVTWPDGSSSAVPVSASGTALTFSLTPAQAGTALLTFTMTGADGTTSVDSMALRVQGSGGGGTKILSLTPAAATVNTPTAFAALADAPISSATLKVTYSGGRVENVPVTASGRILSFSFSPTVTGTALLTFTMTGTDGTISIDSAALTVRVNGGVRVSGLVPSESVAGEQTAFTATTSRLVAGAVLQVSWPDGSFTTVPVTISGDTLSFSLTPTQVGRAVLIFTMTEADGSMSTDAISLPIRSSTPRSSLIQSITVTPAPPYRVGSDLQITVLLARQGDVVMYVDTPRGTIERLVVTQSGNTAAAHYIPEWPGTYRLVVEASDGNEFATAAFSFRAAEGSVVRRRSSGGCDAGFGLMTLLALGGLALIRRRKA